MGPNHPSPHINLTREVQNKRKPSMQFLTIAYFCWSRVLHDHRSVGPKSACVICFSPMGFHHYSPISHKPTRASLCSPSTPLHAHFRQILPDAYPAPGSDRYAIGSSPIRFLDGFPPAKICIPHGCIKSQSNHHQGSSGHSIQQTLSKLHARTTFILPLSDGPNHMPAD